MIIINGRTAGNPILYPPTHPINNPAKAKQSKAPQEPAIHLQVYLPTYLPSHPLTTTTATTITIHESRDDGSEGRTMATPVKSR